MIRRRRKEEGKFVALFSRCGFVRQRRRGRGYRPVLNVSSSPRSTRPRVKSGACTRVPNRRRLVFISTREWQELSAPSAVTCCFAALFHYEVHFARCRRIVEGAGIFGTKGTMDQIYDESSFVGACVRNFEIRLFRELHVFVKVFWNPVNNDNSKIFHTLSARIIRTAVN